MVRNDNTIRHDNKFYQILTRWNGRKPTHVIIEDRLDGKRWITDQSKELRYREIKEPPRQAEVKQKVLRRPKVSSPAPDHPWRKLILAQRANPAQMAA